MWVVVVVVTVALTVLAAAIGYAGRRRIGRSPERDRLEEATRSLGPLDRLRVARAISKGRPVTDPRLAPAAVARARYVRTFGRRVLGGRLVRFVVVFGVLWLGFGVARLATADGTLERMVGIGAVVGAVSQLTIPWQHRYYGRRAERAEELNRQLL